VVPDIASVALQHVLFDIKLATLAQSAFDIGRLPQPVQRTRLAFFDWRSQSWRDCFELEPDELAPRLLFRRLSSG
jgi:hypothetical protein